MTENNNTETPITGVMNVNTVPYIWDYELIDLDYFNIVEEYGSESDEAENYDCDEPTYLIGYKLDEGARQYEEDTDAPFSAIIRGYSIQVTRSNTFARCYHCSPCFPGQGDLDTPGDLLTYALPLDLFDDFGPCPYEVI